MTKEFLFFLAYPLMAQVPAAKPSVVSNGKPQGLIGTGGVVDIPHVLVYTKSPAGVYARQQEFIEINIVNMCSEMKKRWGDIATLLATSTTAKLLFTQRLSSPEGEAQQKVWKNFIALRIKASKPEKNDAKAATPETDKFVEAMKEMQLHPMSASDIGPKFSTCTPFSLGSMMEFQAAVDAWNKPAITKIRLPEPHDNVFTALGLEKLADQAKGLEHTNLTLGRLLRTFRGTFVISEGDYHHRFTSCLVRIDSPLMENMILTKGKGKTGVIPVTAVYVLDQRHEKTPEKVTSYDEKTCVIYLEMPLEFVLSTLQQTFAALQEIVTESGDDVL